MPTLEPLATGWVLLTAGLLVALGALSSRVSRRFGLPFYLVFLAIGMLAGENGPGDIAFDDYATSFRIGTLALVLILFDGGLNTRIATVRRVLAPAATLATVGVLAIAALTALVARGLGLSWEQALLVGAIVSSTDAAAVFAQLRGSGLHLQGRVAATIEVESGLNDPMAVFLTFGVTAWLAGSSRGVAALLVDLPIQFAVGGAVGVAVGWGAGRLLARLRAMPLGLYPVLTTATALAAFGLSTVLGGSGFLAVYLAGLLLGARQLPYRVGLVHVHDAAAWLAQVGMFLLLGLLVTPADALPALGWGVALALALTLLIRPLTVALCLAPFRYTRREYLFVGWTGLRGAVPIVLAIYPVLVGLPGSQEVFHGVFFVVLLGALLPGATLGRVARRAGLDVLTRPAPPALLEIVAGEPLEGEIFSFWISPELAVHDTALRDVPLPEATSVLLVVRDGHLLPARGSTVFQAGDHVLLFGRESDRPTLELFFGASQESAD